GRDEPPDAVSAIPGDAGRVDLGPDDVPGRVRLQGPHSAELVHEESRGDEAAVGGPGERRNGEQVGRDRARAGIELLPLDLSRVVELDEPEGRGGALEPQGVGNEGVAAVRRAHDLDGALTVPLAAAEEV